MAAYPPNSAREATETNSATFQITSAKLCITVVLLSIDNNSKFLQHIKHRCVRIISWNKYRSEIKTTQKRQFWLYDLSGS